MIKTQSQNLRGKLPPQWAIDLAIQTLTPRTNALEWATKNAQIVHPVRGRISFKPYPYQTSFLQDKSNRRIILKARQIGYSQVFAIEALHTAITVPESTVLLVSRSQDLAINLLRYCYQAYNGLKSPPDLSIGNAGELGMRNGSRIKSIPANRSTGRGFSATDVYLDEFAYAAFSEDIYQSVSPTLSQGGRLTIASTPHGQNNLFYKLWQSGNFSKHKIDWTQCPAYYTNDEKEKGIPPEESEWYLANRKNYTYTAWASEYDCNFMLSVDALWKRTDIDNNRVLQCPDLDMIIVGVDPSASSAGDEAGIVTGGRKGEHYYTLADDSIQGSPETWAKAAVTAYHRHKANRIVAEKNNGGEMVLSVIRQVDPNVPVKLVHASRGKATRAEPVSTLSEQGRDHHVGTFAALEDELCMWTQGDASPNRLDAKVWMVTELMDGGVPQYGYNPFAEYRG